MFMKSSGKISRVLKHKNLREVYQVIKMGSINCEQKGLDILESIRC